MSFFYQTKHLRIERPRRLRIVRTPWHQPTPLSLITGRVIILDSWRESLAATNNNCPPAQNTTCILKYYKVLIRCRRWIDITNIGIKLHKIFRYSIFKNGPLLLRSYSFFRSLWFGVSKRIYFLYVNQKKNLAAMSNESIQFGCVFVRTASWPWCYGCSEARRLQSAFI